MAQPRVTELRNPFTTELDKASAVEFVRLFRQVDQQLFSGWDVYPGIYDVLSTVAAVSRAATGPLLRTITGTEKNVFVFSGCGTSGRVAWLVARGLNAMLQAVKPGAPPCFKYLLSGGDEALIVSKELPEDDPNLGARELESAIEGCDNSFFFGITCGLSAPYVGGQIELAMSISSCTAVLVGFNPIELARDAPVENWSTTCKQVFTELQQRAASGENAFVLNPVVGPEGVTGSSRMKGGSMTKVLLEAVFLPILAHICDFNDFLPTPELQIRCTDLAADAALIGKLVMMYEQTYRETYRAIDEIASVVEATGRCLRHPSGHLYYVGEGVAGMIGMMDASEMVDTYGSRLDEVRTFIDSGWARCSNNEGDISDIGPLFNVSWNDFIRNCCPLLTKQDMVILVNVDPAAQIIEKVESSKAKLSVLNVVQWNKRLDSYFVPAIGGGNTRYEAVAAVQLSVREPSLHYAVFSEFSLKLAMNLITTGANTMKGRVVGNTMINLTVSNNKLFQRSAEIVAEITGASFELSRDCLLRAIHGVDELTADIINGHPLSYHIEIATPKSNIVPTAALLATQKYSFKETQTMLDSQQSLRSLIAEATIG